MDDRELLACYIADASEEAFGELVRRHIDFVYRSALRRLAGDTHLAKDVTQLVFIALAREAGRVREGSLLMSWLHGSTRRAAAQAVRTEQRRRQREIEHMKMYEPGNSETEPTAAEITLALDRALDALNAADRQALFLRFFDQAGFAEIARRLGVSEDGARMRVDRALDRLRRWFARRGLTSSAAALGAAMSAEAGLGAPAGLAGTITAASLGSTGSAGAGATVLGFMTTTKLGLAAVAAAALAAGAGLDQWKTASRDQPLSNIQAMASVRPASPVPGSPINAGLAPAGSPTRAAQAESLSITAVLSELDLDRRRLAIANLVTAAGEPDLRGLLRQLAAEPSTARRDEVVYAVYRRWGELNPDGAFAAIAEFNATRTDVPRWNQAILEGWSGHDLEGPIRWVRAHAGNFPDADHDGYPDALLHAIADSALSADRVEVVRAAALAPREDAAGGEFATQYLLSELMNYYARYDLPAAVALMGRFPAGSPGHLTTLNLLSQSLAQESPDVAANLAFSLPASTDSERDDRRAVIGTSFSVLGTVIDPGQAENWINRQPHGPDLDAAIEAMAPGLVARDSAAAARVLKAIESPARRGTVVLQAAQTLRNAFSFREALDFAAANYPDTADRPTTLKSFAVTLASFHGARPVAEYVQTMGGVTPGERDAILQAPALQK